jgi:membrane-associated phospholipid phosphatase
VIAAVVFFGLLTYLAWKVAAFGGWRWVITVGATLAVIGVAFGRIYLNAHWLTDVLGAGAAGLALVFTVIATAGDRLGARALT